MKNNNETSIDIQNVWEFIEKYYPNYYKCDTILYLQDLEKVANREYEVGAEDNSAWQLFLQLEQDCKESGKDLEDYIFNELEKETKEVYEKAIQGYLDAQKETDPIEEAKEVLKKAGYITDFLWHESDIQDVSQEDFETELTDKQMEEVKAKISDPIYGDEGIDRGMIKGIIRDILEEKEG